MIDKERLVKIGVLAKPHGVTGEMLIRLVPSLAGAEPSPSWLFIDVDGGLVPFEVLSVRLNGHDALLARLDTITSSQKCRLYQGADIYINKPELGTVEETGFTIHHLKGYSVVDKNLGVIGDISAIVDIKNNPLAEIIYKGKSILIPVQAGFIVSVDNGSRTILMDAPDGLIDLYLDLE